MNIFLPMKKVPTITHQEKKVRVVNGRPIFYEPEQLKQVRMEFTESLYPHRPVKPLQGPIKLQTVWMFDTADERKLNTWKTTKPDTDNLVKLLKDCMTDCGYWMDDAQVCKEEIQKVWARPSGIYINIEEL